LFTAGGCNDIASFPAIGSRCDPCPGFTLKSRNLKPPIAFTHIAVIDTEGALIQQDMTVVIVGDHIADVGRAVEIKVPSTAQVIDGRGKFLIPGLWDMHVHIFSEGRFPIVSPLLIANGVTGVREMGT
jgi:predicted amidohydrolase